MTPSRWRARSLGGERGTPSHAVVTVRRRRARDEPPSEHAIRCGRSLSRNNVELKAPCPPVGQKLLEGDQCPSSGCSRRPRTTTGGGRGERLRVSWGGGQMSLCRPPSSSVPKQGGEARSLGETPGCITGRRGLWVESPGHPPHRGSVLFSSGPLTDLTAF